MKSEAAGSAAAMSVADRFGIGPGRHRRHAVDLLEALPAIEAGARAGRKPREVEVFGVCGERVTLARKWGRYDYGNRNLDTRRCERCSWIIALHHRTIEQEIACYQPDSVDRALILSGGHNPDLLPKLIAAVLDTHQDQQPDRPEPGLVSELLAHICRHRPIGVMCARCWDDGLQEAHGPHAQVCPEAVVACWACTFIAGSWAGEFEDTIGSCECIVTSPCSVLTAVAAHHAIGITAGSGTAPASGGGDVHEH